VIHKILKDKKELYIYKMKTFYIYGWIL